MKGVCVEAGGIWRATFAGEVPKGVLIYGLSYDIGYEGAKAYWSPVEHGKKELDGQSREGSPVG
jgi:hypothetical protein